MIRKAYGAANGKHEPHACPKWYRLHEVLQLTPVERDANIKNNQIRSEVIALAQSQDDK
jgi:hypothetical protein